MVGVLLKDQKKKEAKREKKVQEKEAEALRVRKANSRGIMLVLRYMLKRYHSEYILQGRITYNQYRDWMDLYEAYRALDGNSIASEWNDDVEHMEKCESLSEMSPFESMLRQHMDK